MTCLNDSGTPIPSPSPSPSSPKLKSPKSADSNGVLRPLRLKDICVGCIVWLPGRVKDSQSLCCKNTGVLLDDGGYDHPVVIVNVENDAGPHVVSIAIVTSFHSVSLDDYLKRRSSNKNWNASLPILTSAVADTFPTPFPVPNLRLVEDKHLGWGKKKKQSFVKLSNVYDVPISSLRAYKSSHRAHEFRLDEASYRLLGQTLHIQVETYPPFDRIWESNKERLQKLGHICRDDCGGIVPESKKKSRAKSKSSSADEFGAAQLVPEQSRLVGVGAVLLPDRSTMGTVLKNDTQHGYGTVIPDDQMTLPYPVTYTPVCSRRISLCFCSTSCCQLVASLLFLVICYFGCYWISSGSGGKAKM